MNRYRILIAADEPGAAKELKDRLEGMGFHVNHLTENRVPDPAMTANGMRDVLLLDARQRGMEEIASAVEANRASGQLPLILLGNPPPEQTCNRVDPSGPFCSLSDSFDSSTLLSTMELALSNHDTRQEIQRLGQLFDVLSLVNRAVGRAGTLEELLPSICRITVECGAIDLAWIGSLDTQSAHILPIAYFGEGSKLLNRVPLCAANPHERSRTLRAAILEGNPFRCQGCSGGACPLCSDVTEARFGFHSCCIFPIQLGGKPWGVFTVCSQKPCFFREREIRYLNEVALGISFALERVERQILRKHTEMELRQSNDRRSALFERARDAILIADADTGILLEANAEAMKLLGRPRSAIIGLHQSRIHPSDRLEESRELFRKSVLNDGQLPVETEVQRADGTRVPVEVSSSVVSLPGGQRLMQGFFRDLTDRKSSEESLHKSVERFQQAMEAASDGIWDWDVATGDVYCSPGCFRMLGYEPDESSRDFTSWVSLGHPDDRERTLAAYDSCLRNQSQAVRVEFRARSRDGSWHWILGRGRVTRRDHEGRALKMMGTHVDITERKAAEHAQRESEERLKLALDASLMGVWEWDVPTGAVYWSPECCGILGVECRQGTIQSFTNTVHAEDVARIITSAKIALKNKTAYAEEYRILRPDGEIRWVSNFARTSYAPDGTPLRVVGTIQDISERKEAEEKRRRVEAQLMRGQKMEALGTLAGGIAHDFNNILTIISGYAEMVAWELSEEHALQEEVRQILNATDRAKDLVRQILAFSRRTDQETKPVQVEYIVKEALKMLRATLPSTIAIRTRVSSTAFVLSDPTQIHQVLMNLCTNAAHAMREQGGLLEVELTDVLLSVEEIRQHSGLQPGPHVKLTVRDTGHGIDPSLMDLIFDPFFTTKDPGVGTGLGLSVVHGIVNNHGGAIEVESIPGEGTTFHIWVPAMDGPAEPGITEIDALPGGRERILLVDDEPVLGMAAKRMLERLGYEVDLQPDGLEGLMAFRGSLADTPFDLVITDMTMPKLTGADLTKELLRDWPGLPVILSTGFSENMDEDKAESIGAGGFLMKPYAWRQLAELVRRVLDKN